MGKYVLTDEQENAVKGISKWFKNQERQTTSLVGYAGTGKTFLVEHVANELKLNRDTVVFAALTGKASLVLQERVKKYVTSTIHRLIYETKIINGDPVFQLKEKKKLKHLKLIVIDEASMVSQNIYNDLISFDIPVLFIGDEGQLPPIGKPFNVLENPDYKLTKIHRQAESNPIIYLSMLARENRKIEPGSYKNKVLVLNKNSLEKKKMLDLYTRADQIICGYNNTRKRINKETRRNLKFKSELPEEGDKIICLKNNWDIGAGGIPLINGLTGYVNNAEFNINKKMKKPKSIRESAMHISFTPDIPDADMFEEILCLEDDFMNKKIKLEHREKRVYERFDYGYAITCHKSQGSQFKNVFVENEVLNSDLHHKWLYTAITRSSENLILSV